MQELSVSGLLLDAPNESGLKLGSSVTLISVNVIIGWFWLMVWATSIILIGWFLFFIFFINYLMLILDPFLWFIDYDTLLHVFEFHITWIY